MRAFKDAIGRAWELRINVDAIQDLRDRKQIDLLQVLNGELGGRIADDPILAAGIVATLCADQFGKHGTDEKGFTKELFGDSLGDAMTALQEEIIDFFPSPKVRENLRTLLTTSRKVAEKAMAMASERVASLDIDTAAAAMLDPPKPSSGGAPESSESTPARSSSAA